MTTPAYPPAVPLRSGLITNGLRLDHLTKAAAADLDLVHIELEDGVPEDRKPEAREVIVEALRTLDWGHRMTLVRVARLADGHIEDDVATVVAGGATGILLGKCAGPEDVVTVDELLTAAEERAGVPVGTTRIATMIERARALQRCEDIAEASERMLALYIGPSDLGNEVGYRRTYDGLELETLYARSRIVLAAHAAGILAISPRYGPYREVGEVDEVATWLFQLGFDVVTCVSPTELPSVNRAFAPNERELEWARKVLAGGEEARAKGTGAWVVDGSMVDAPHVERAKRIIEAARVAGGGS